jgi:hypothetical protein
MFAPQRNLPQVQNYPFKYFNFLEVGKPIFRLIFFTSLLILLYGTFRFYLDFIVMETNVPSADIHTVV